MPSALFVRGSSWGGVGFRGNAPFHKVYFSGREVVEGINERVYLGIGGGDGASGEGAYYGVGLGGQGAMQGKHLLYEGNKLVVLLLVGGVWYNRVMPETTPLSPSQCIIEYLHGHESAPLFLMGDACRILRELPDNTIDFCMTSPPYWGQREYQAGGIGEEKTYGEYVSSLLAVFRQVRRVLKPTGSFWLNIGDKYQSKSLLGLPWRIALAMTDQQQWILRNDIIWDKIKGGLDQSADKLRNVHEHVFHFTKQSKHFYYNVDAIKSAPRKAKMVNGALVSATGVSGKRYKRQIELSTALTEQEKVAALSALEGVLSDIHNGILDDFRMVIRDQHRTTHSNATRVSGRAKELRDTGFYFLKYDPKGTKPSDVWAILPEDAPGKSLHYAPYPEELCVVPLLATCPPGGIVLDIFCGTGTTNIVAGRLGHKSIGIDLSPQYIAAAQERARVLL